MFTKLALKNIRASGNVWGTTTEYVYKFNVPLPFGWVAKVEQRRASNFMGRFGGGWQIKLGVQGSFGGSWLISIFVCSIHIMRRK